MRLELINSTFTLKQDARKQSTSDYDEVDGWEAYKEDERLTGMDHRPMSVVSDKVK
jgi:hypothetical protein